MLIRCEKCQALYSLQDGVVRGPQGDIPQTFAVECGRCMTQFEAQGPTNARSSARKTPPPPSGRAVKPKSITAAEQSGLLAPTSANLAKALKPVRPAETPPPEDDEFSRQLASGASRRKMFTWLVVLLILGAIGVFAVPMLRKRFASVSPAATSKLEQARKLILLDDFQSLERAAELDTQAAKLSPGEPGPQGEKAFALLLAAGAHKDLADRGEARATALGDEIAKLQINKPEGFEKQVDAIRTQMLQLNDEREPHVHAANQLLKAGSAAARTALDADPDEPNALRAMALYAALNNAVDSGVSYADKSEGFAPNEPFTTYVRAQLWLCGSASREKQDKGLGQLALVRQSAPNLLRALYDTAAIEADRQLAPQAREKLDKLLQENPAHERAKALRATLAAH